MNFFRATDTTDTTIWKPGLSKNVPSLPRSSKVHHLIKNIATRKKSTPKTSSSFAQKMRKPIFQFLAEQELLLTGVIIVKGVIHTGNCTKYKLHNDIEKNPAPVMHHVDPSKTIQAPYHQGDVVVFGQNAGQQCVEMSLCPLTRA